MNRRRLVSLSVALCGPSISCAPPPPVTGLGTDQTYAPRIVAIESMHGTPERVTIALPRAALVTVLDVEDGAAPRVVLRLASAEQSSRPLAAGTHELVLAPVRAARDTVTQDAIADVLASMGKPIGGVQRMEGVGSVPLETCPDANPAAPTFCPVPPTEPLVKLGPVPPDHYLICIAHADPVDAAQLRARLRDADLGLRGRELVTEIATRASGGERGSHWAATAVRH